MARKLALLLGVGLALIGDGALAAEPAASGSRYNVGPSEVAPPAGVPVGAYRRIVHPFQNWTLVCDENLQSLEKICNVSQTILGDGEQPVFSWSLAVTESGDPMMIVRSPVGMTGNRMTITLDAAPQGIPVTMECDQRACAGLLRIDSRIRDAIGSGQVAGVTYTSRQGGVVHLDAPLEGLAAALAAIS